MIRGVRAVALGVLLLGCAERAPVPERDLDLRVTAVRGPVEFGQGFPLTVERVWSRRLVPDPWSDDVLAPLHLVREGGSRRESGTHVAETRSFRAHAFTLDDVVVPSLVLRARPESAGEPRIAQAPPLVLRVTPSVDRSDPGPPELPGEPLGDPFPWTLAAAVAGAAALALLLLVARTRRTARSVPTEAAPAAEPTAAERALARIAALRAAPSDVRAWSTELAEALRAFLAEAHGLGSPERTSEELVELARRARLAGAGEVEAVLRDCDLVKFARRAPTASEREETLGAAEDFVRRSVLGPGRDPGAAR